MASGWSAKPKQDLVPSEPEDFETQHPEPFPLAEQAVQLYLESGSLAQVGREMHIPVQELYRAAKSPWWIQEVGLRARMEKAATNAKMTQIINMTLTEIEDRLINGEDAFDVKGNRFKKNVQAVHLARIVDVLFDKRQVLRGEPTAQDRANHKLAELADKLEKLGRMAAATPILDAEEVTVKKDGSQE